MPATRRSQRVANAAATRKAPPPAAAGTATTTTSSSKKKKATKARKASSSKSAAAAAAARPTKKTKRTGLQDAVSATAPLGVVDPESRIQGTIEMIDDEPADAMLVLCDPAQNNDKFFVLQCIRHQNDDGGYAVYSRWGRTGTVGQALIQDFENQADAVQAFGDKFQQKTGLMWEERQSPYKGGKYRFIVQDFVEKQAGYANATWQYWVDDGVDGKAVGWYDYDAAASCKVERLYHEHLKNQNGGSTLSSRLIDSGAWTYNVDLVKMTQTNATHPAHTSRRIRRVSITAAAGKQDDGDVMQETTLPAKTSTAPPPATPPPRPAAAAAAAAAASITTVTPSPAKAASAASSASASSQQQHPVDPDVRVQGKIPSDYEVVCGQEDENGPVWYDVVLNQCNITGSSNNNKYYRLQIVKDSSSAASLFYVWQKWGRVGEPARTASSNFQGPFTSWSAAYKIFAKKYKDKTGNVFGADPFVPKKKKYVPIEIDNNVEPVMDNSESSTPSKTEYLPSKLDATTRELVETLFSKEMRNEALTEFHLDLKKLPLGVPSQPQIQRGIVILDQIKNALAATTATSTANNYEELSSQFYTAIPHSFGRARPPVINTMTLLQQRYDMCDILLDMYDTNETIREIDQKKNVGETTTQKVPPPVDEHYDSLKANLELVDHASSEFGKIQNCFEKTKSGSGAKLLNVWKVDRQNEGRRFAKYSQMGNRKLLWHGTNIAVVAPILTSGLRIMPHAGGRVGAGIYLANMQEKSAQYTSGYGAKYACMFLTEAALGKISKVDSDGPHAYSLRAAPDGYDSVLAVGQTSPSEWDSMELDGNTVQIPQSGGTAHANTAHSSFYHDEHLCYDEAQVRLRYVLTVKLY